MKTKPQFQPSKIAKPTDVPLPPQWRYKISLGAFRKFTKMERFKIAIGMNVKVDVEIGVEQRPGKFAADIKLYVTEQIEATPMLEIAPPN